MKYFPLMNKASYPISVSLYGKTLQQPYLDEIEKGKRNKK